MPRKDNHAAIRKELTGYLAPSLPGIRIEVQHNDRWGRTCATLRWDGFTDTLPEERFRRVLLCIPEDYRVKHLAGVMWLELAPDETVDDYLALPRSEDIADREPAIARTVAGTGFFEALEQHLSPLPVEQTVIDLSTSKRILRAKKLSEREVRDACLLFLRHGAYCDAEVLLRARPEILALEDTP